MPVMLKTLWIIIDKNCHCDILILAKIGIKCFKNGHSGKQKGTLAE
jgi:hypothetical protein